MKRKLYEVTFSILIHSALQSFGSGQSLYGGTVYSNNAKIPSLTNIARNFITFPTDPSEIILNDKNCSIEDGVIYYNGICSILLSNLACKEDQWLIINPSGMPQCVQRPCPPEELLFDGVCVNILDDSVCGISQILFVELTGETYCDCIPEFIYDPAINTCVAEHRQGSCPPGMVLELKGEQVTCVKNYCTTVDQIYNSVDGQCYKKTFLGTCSKKEFELIFKKSEMIAICAATTIRNIWEVPPLKCPSESKRNHFKRCSKVFNNRNNSQWSLKSNVRIPSVSTMTHTSYCPPSHKRLPSGVCKSKSVNRLFSG